MSDLTTVEKQKKILGHKTDRLSDGQRTKKSWWAVKSSVGAAKICEGMAKKWRAKKGRLKKEEFARASLREVAWPFGR